MERRRTRYRTALGASKRFLSDFWVGKDPWPLGRVSKTRAAGFTCIRTCLCARVSRSRSAGFRYSGTLFQAQKILEANESEKEKKKKEKEKRKKEKKNGGVVAKDVLKIDDKLADVGTMEAVDMLSIT